MQQVTLYGIAAFTEQRQHKELGSTQSNADDHIVELPAGHLSDKISILAITGKQLTNFQPPFPSPSLSIHIFPPPP